MGTGNWNQQSYMDALTKVRAVLENARQGKYPKCGNYDRYVVWGKEETEIWVEFPAQILPQVVKGYEDVIKEVKPLEWGYHFYESSFIRIK